MKLFTKLFVGLTILLFASGCGSKYFLNSGVKDYNNLYYSNALTKFEKSLAKDSANYDANVMLAKTNMKMHDYKEAASYYKNAIEYPQSMSEDKLDYAKSLMAINDHVTAEKVLSEYISTNPGDRLASSMHKSCQYITLFLEDSAKYEIKAIPVFGNISVFSPVKFGDGIVFTAEKSAEKNKNPWTGNSFYEVQFAEGSGDEWSGSTLLADKLNSNFHDGPISFNGDETKAIITRSYKVNDKKRGKGVGDFNNLWLYSTQYQDSVWQELEALPFNSIDYTCMHPALSKDGNTLYFASDMPDGFGGTDLYKSTFVNGEWTDPVNLGARMNTAGDESFPTIGEDSELYFSSNGHASLGGLDIFKSNNKIGVWEYPVNLNYPINSVSDDFGYIYVPEDSLGYFSSKRNGYDQIFSFVENIKGVVHINGLVVDKVSGLPLEGAMVTLIDKDTGEVLETLHTGADGKFELFLLAERNYKILAEKDGYLVQSLERSTMKQYENEEADVVLRMEKMVITDPNDPLYNPSTDPNSGIAKDGNGIYSVPNIFYNLDKYDIRPDAAYELEKVYKVLKDNPKISIEMHSHTDSRYTDGYNMRLSINRAKAARSWLIKKGISASRISYKGFGESRLANRCKDGVECTEEEHQANRRTEFIITEVKK